jgi:hypothetical protein
MREADDLTTFMSLKSGSLNLLEPSGPHQACYGNPLPLPYDNISLTASWNIKYFRQKLSEKWKPHFIFKNFFFRKSSRLWSNVAKYGRGREATDDNKIWRMHFACWIKKATKALRVRNNYCFLQPKWLRESTSLSRSYKKLRLLALVSIIRIIFHDLLVLNAILIIRTRGRSLGTIKQNSALWRVWDRNALPNCFFFIFLL